MPELKPFRGIRYSSRDLAERVCPPYDVISPDEQRLLYDRHPENAVRLELPMAGDPGDESARYRSAAAQFETWLAEGVLARDDEPALYVYRQEFTTGNDRERRSVAGIVGALTLEPFGTTSGVLPHERTMRGPIDDRLALLRNCPVNISPIYLIYRGSGAVADVVDELGGRPPDARFGDDAGILHRLWAIRSGAEVGVLADAVGSSTLVIADGHHRYETALAYRDDQSAPGEHDAVMAFCVDADAADLVVLPYHRGIEASADPGALRDALVDAFRATPVPLERAHDALHGSRADHAFLFLLQDGCLLVELDDAAVVAAAGDRHEAWRALDVVALHEVVVPRLFPKGEPGFFFSRDAGEIARAVSGGRCVAGVLLKPLRPVDVIDVARSGERMPQKASYFWPKAVTGLVFRSLR